MARHLFVLLALVVIAVTSALEFPQYDDAVVYRPRGRIPIPAAPRVRRQGTFDSAGSVQEVKETVPRYRRQGGGGEGVVGPVHTFVKTDEHAHFKWGVRHHVGHEYAGR